MVHQKLFSDCLSSTTRNLSKVNCWKLPNQNYLKLNTDGALFVDLQDASTGAILRNSEGEVIMAASLKEKAIQYPETIECLAILRCIQLYSNQGISHLLVESDCQSINLQIQDLASIASPFENIIHEIRLLMKQYVDCQVLLNHR